MINIQWAKLERKSIVTRSLLRLVKHEKGFFVCIGDRSFFEVGGKLWDLNEGHAKKKKGY